MSVISILMFVCPLGNEYPAIVEFAPFQKIPKKKAKKADARQGTIENGMTINE